MSRHSLTEPRAVEEPIAATFTAGGFWLMGTTAVALLVLYLVGIDQGAVSVLGADSHIHEFLHDGRHLLGFPCH